MLIKTTLLCGALLVTACANVGNGSADINDCRKIAYGSHSDALGNDSETRFSQCKAKKQAMRADENTQETTFIWLEFFLHLFVPSDPSNT
jgi:hypothetical protein